MAREAIISSNRLNSYGTRVLTAGIDLEQYEKNPIVLYMHRRGGREDMPIGTMTNLRVENDVLYGTPDFDKDDDFARRVEAKWEKGVLRMLSAGLDVLEWSEDPQYLVPGQTRATVTKSKLYEVSVVDIGSNDDALQVHLRANGKLLTLSQGEENDLLPLLKADKSQTNKIHFQMNKILTLLGLAAAASEEEAVAAIKKLQDDLAALNLARVTDVVQNAIDTKRITADKKDHFITLGQRVGVDSLRETLTMFAPAQKPTDIIRETDGKRVALAWEEMTDAEKIKLRDENRSEYIRLFKEHYGVEPEFE